jgi:hypothetical protein
MEAELEAAERGEKQAGQARYTERDQKEETTEVEKVVIEQK